MSLRNPIDIVRQPEYTGENRCLPCTVVNLLVAAVTGVIIAGGLDAVGVSRSLSILSGIVVFSVSVALTALRGYVVPGTPTLTKRYMPTWMLRLFGKTPEPPRDEAGTVDVEAILREAEVVEECPKLDDLCLTVSFETAWRERIDAREALEPDVREFLTQEELDEYVDREEVAFEERGEAWVALLDGTNIAQWESRAAYLADVAAASELRERYPEWYELGFDDRMEVVGSLRLWLDWCPSCDGPVVTSQETVASCCRERQVLAIGCDACGSRLFEADVPPEAIETARVTLSDSSLV